MTEKIIEFVEKHFKEYIYEKLRLSTENSYDSYSQFIDHNKKTIETLNCRDVEFLLRLIEEISAGHILQADSEHFVGRKITLFYFDKSSNLILIH